MRVAAIHRPYERSQQTYGNGPARADELAVAQGLMLGSVLGAFIWGVFAGIV